MYFESFVAARYMRGKRKNRFVSLITVISVAGVSVGVMALIVVMSVMTGFDIALRETIIGNRAHLTVGTYTGQPIRDYEAVIADVRKVLGERFAGAGPITQIQALLQHGERTPEGAFVIGVNPELEQDVTMLEENLSRTGGREYGRGELPEYKEIVLGYRLAQRLGVRIGSTVRVLTATMRLNSFGMPTGRPVAVTVSGISQAKMSDFDNLYAFTNIETAQMLTGREGVDAINVRLDNAEMAEEAAALIMQEMDFVAQTWYEHDPAFFAALKQEKVVMFIILAFIVLVAAFNITSTLIMIVMEKRRDIGILRTLGAGSGSILRLFVIQGLMIGLSGTFLGVILGSLFAYNLNSIAVFIAGLFNVNLFDSSIYYFDRIPVAVVPLDIFWITLSAVILTFASTLYPAWSASRLQPVDALRYE